MIAFVCSGGRTATVVNRLTVYFILAGVIKISTEPVPRGGGPVPFFGPAARVAAELTPQSFEFRSRAR